MRCFYHRYLLRRLAMVGPTATARMAIKNMTVPITFT